MAEPRRIAVVTSSRADYGLLYWTMREIDDDPDLDLQLVVTGAHLSPHFGLTYRQIAADGFGIAAEVPMGLEDDSPLAVSKALAQELDGIAGALVRLRPDLLVVLGDRYEILAAVQAAMLQGIPIAHIHGGESTEGLIDEAVRHAVTKFSHLHFVAAEPYARRVIQMGEQPDRVHVVGAAGFDNLVRMKSLNRRSLETELDFRLGKQNFLVTFHPETLNPSCAERQVSPLLEALDGFVGSKVIVTGSNADPAGHSISILLRKHADARHDRFCYRESLGQKTYLSLLRQVSVVVGNSSSGIIEAPAVGVAVVNIGERQRNRLRSPAIIDCANDSESIRGAITHALSREHQVIASERVTPYGTAGASRRIRDVIKATPLEGLLQKRFFDFPVASPQ